MVVINHVKFVQDNNIQVIYSTLFDSAVDQRIGLFRQFLNLNPHS